MSISLKREQDLLVEISALQTENAELKAAFAKITTIKVPRNFPNQECTFLDDFGRCSALFGYFCKKGKQNCPLPVLVEFEDEAKP